jgi:hypothetical protein
MNSPYGIADIAPEDMKIFFLRLATLGSENVKMLYWQDMLPRGAVWALQEIDVDHGYLWGTG